MSDHSTDAADSPIFGDNSPVEPVFETRRQEVAPRKRGGTTRVFKWGVAAVAAVTILPFVIGFVQIATKLLKRSSQNQEIAAGASDFARFDHLEDDGRTTTNDAYIRGKCLVLDHDSESMTATLHQWHDASRTDLFARTRDEVGTVIWLESRMENAGHYMPTIPPIWGTGGGGEALEESLEVTIIDLSGPRVIGRASYRARAPDRVEGKGPHRFYVQTFRLDDLLEYMRRRSQSMSAE